MQHTYSNALILEVNWDSVFKDLAYKKSTLDKGFFYNGSSNGLVPSGDKPLSVPMAMAVPSQYFSEGN